jgi:type II secretory pathway component PulF
VATSSLSLDDLVALNDEIAGIVSAGIPLELGLATWSNDLSGPLRTSAAALSQSVAQGRGLGEALADESLNIPPVYRAVVAAGLRSGRLPAALEAITENARHLKQLRRAVALAMIYPIMLVLLAYGLMLVLLGIVLPAMLALFEGRLTGVFLIAQRMADFAWAMIPIPGTSLGVPVVVLPPLVFIAAVATWWVKTRRAVVLDVTAAARWLCCVPRAGRAVRHARAASLADVFGLLIEHGVPLADALRLSATCTGDRKLAQSAGELAVAVEQGHLPTRARLEAAGIPSLLALLVAGGARQQTLVAMARQVAGAERDRVERDVQWLRDWLPVWMILIVGSLVGLIYCLSFFVPFSQFMQSLGGAMSSSLRIRS